MAFCVDSMHLILIHCDRTIATINLRMTDISHWNTKRKMTKWLTTSGIVTFVYPQWDTHPTNAISFLLFADGISERSNASKPRRNCCFPKMSMEHSWFEIPKVVTMTIRCQVSGLAIGKRQHPLTTFSIWLTVRDGDTVKHYRIRQLDEGGFFIARRTTFRWVRRWGATATLNSADCLEISIEYGSEQPMNYALQNRFDFEFWTKQIEQIKPPTSSNTEPFKSLSNIIPRTPMDFASICDLHAFR